MITKTACASFLDHDCPKKVRIARTAPRTCSRGIQSCHSGNWGARDVSRGVLGSSLAYCPGCFLALVHGVAEPDRPLGRIWQRDEFAQCVESGRAVNFRDPRGLTKEAAILLAGGLEFNPLSGLRPVPIGGATPGNSGAGGYDPVKDNYTPLPQSLASRLLDLIFNQGADSADKPAGVPDNWREEPTKGDGGRQWVNPDNPGDRVRVAPGNPDSPNPGQREPYVRDVRNGNQWLDVSGNRVEGKTGRNSPDTHVPVKDYVFRP